MGAPIREAFGVHRIPALTKAVEYTALQTLREIRIRLFTLLLFALLCLLLDFTGQAAIPTPEKLLPDDTLVVVTAPDWAKAKQAWQQLPQIQLWNDPALRAFKDSFLSKWNENLVKPLERELNVKLSDYTDLLQGQVTFALTQNGWHGDDSSSVGLLLLVDTKDQSARLKTKLSEIRRQWAEAGKAVRVEKIREVEFAILSLSTNDVPKSLRKILPKSSDVDEAGDDAQPKAPPAKNDLVLGQVQSLLIAGNSTKAVEKIVARLTGGSLPALSDVAAFQADYAARLRDAPVYAWVHVAPLLDAWFHQGADAENGQAPNPFDLKPEKVVRALGLSSLKTIAATFRANNDGQLFQLFVGVPESSRQGIFKILAGEPKELNPPPFVPADVVKYERWRIDGQKAWSTIEKVLGDISPQWLSGVNFLLQTANTAGRDKDPGFDVRKNVIANLGDDIILYDKAPHSATPGQPGPSLALIASPNAEKLAASLSAVLVFFGQTPGAVPETRDFLGRKIYTCSLGSMPFAMSAAASASLPSQLHYAASGGYVALSSDAATLEEYLRTCDTQGKSLRETPGLAEAMQKVIGPGASWFAYENVSKTMRAALEALRKAGPDASKGAGLSSVVPSELNWAGAGVLQQWMDSSLLPPFEQIAKYFAFSVSGGSATTDGLNFKLFVPIPPGLRQAESKL